MSRSPVLFLLIPALALVLFAWPVQGSDAAYCGADTSASGEPSLGRDAPDSFDDHIAWADRIVVATAVDAACFDPLAGENAYRLSVHASLKGTYEGPITLITTRRMPVNEPLLLFLSGPIGGLYPDNHVRLLRQELAIRGTGGERPFGNLIDVITASPAVAEAMDKARIPAPPVALDPAERAARSDVIAHARVTRLHRSNPYMTVADLALIESFRDALPGEADTAPLVLLPPGFAIGDELLVYLQVNSLLMVTDLHGSVISRDDSVTWAFRKMILNSSN